MRRLAGGELDPPFLAGGRTFLFVPDQQGDRLRLVGAVADDRGEAAAATDERLRGRECRPLDTQVGLF